MATATVEFSGRAYLLGYMETGISNATIKLREFPELSATTDEFGDYRFAVPDYADVTPYILSGEGDLTGRPREGEPTVKRYHWNELDLQTFQTRGEALENVNFQAPADAEYEALMAWLQVPSGEDGRPSRCAIVTTASARNVRGVDYDTFWTNTPHGVEGATSAAEPALPDPIYFNEFVIPDSSRTETSVDGGIVWPVVPAGTYRITTSSPDTRFAEFTATCAPGRVINANPPWGAFELEETE
ncbi:MAG: hypothetical protein JJE13_02700 [Thermoleophilia bacterium]|nr:hypothetical protein [Thermoleophilia bacterium]